MNEYQRHPPQIVHSEPRPAEYRQMIKDAARNIHLRTQATNLLLFYADQMNHFTPALELIERQTGIGAQDVWKVRHR